MLCTWVIIHNMIVDVRKNDNHYDGVVNLRGMCEANLVTKLWKDR